jgi:hypothetical protein
MPLTRLTLSTGQSTYITGTDPQAVALELEDLGASWLEAHVLEYEGKAFDSADWYIRRSYLPHALIVGVSELTDRERRDIPDEILADHDEPTSVDR